MRKKKKMSLRKEIKPVNKKLSASKKAKHFSRGAAGSIRLDRRIYPKHAVEKTLNDFSEVANFKFREEGGYFVLELQAEEKSLLNEDLIDEFVNYMLGKIK
jgi:hypothetical protein